MTDEARNRVAERLAGLQSADERLARALEGVGGWISRVPDGAIDKAPVDGLTKLIADVREPSPAELAGLPPAAQEGASPHAVDSDRGGEASAMAAQAIQAAYVAVGGASGAAAALFTTGRLMFEGAACDLAVDRMKSYAQITKALNALLPQVVGWELREEGLVCHCICPICGLGACGCIWASLHNIDVASGGPGLGEPDDRGIVLRSPPRPGSQLADAGVRQWDWVISVDDQAVRTPGELMTALRRHGIGEEVRLRVQHEGEPRNITVRHASDLP